MENQITTWQELSAWLKSPVANRAHAISPNTIAAAPDLLAACKELVSLWEFVAVRELEGMDLIKSDSPSIVRARAAIDKAEGR